ncbi:DUF6287 domain-containing protein [Streptococcus massiliensis]|uniref:Lipoprotein n=1 Tax=Streptococcus massiliensis TaxID=313439 RepID=A0A380KYX7_9STRE|nr:DUF6287 domain-containing protein [Streptococcus massiliensis]SUN76489.1 lipoprotein [Streptococcus massiliensis]
MKKLGIILGSLLVLLALIIGAIALWGQSQEKGKTVKVTSSAKSAVSKNKSSVKSSETGSSATATTEVEPSSTAANQENSANTSEEKAANKQETQVDTSNFASLQSGDFSSIAGSWSNARGEKLEIDAAGKTTTGMVIEISGRQNNQLIGSIHGEKPGGGGAVFIYIPAGAEYTYQDVNGNKGTVPSDTTRDRLLTVQALPESSWFYYKN